MAGSTVSGLLNKTRLGGCLIWALVLSGCAGPGDLGAGVPSAMPAASLALASDATATVVNPVSTQTAISASSPPAVPAASPTTESAATPAPTPAFEETDGISYDESGGGGGGKNIVKFLNRVDNRLRVRGNIQLNRIPAPTVEPVNLALSSGSCTDCQTLTVALQINLYQRGAPKVAPQNAAVAVNYECTRCYTVARALQYVLPVDDPTQVPPDVSRLIRELDRELKAIQTDRNLQLVEAENRISAVVAQFQQLAQSLNEQRDEATEGTSPDATVVATLGPTATPSPLSSTVTPAETTAPTVATGTVMTGTEGPR